MRRVFDSFLKLDHLDRVYVLDALHELVADNAQVKTWIDEDREYTQLTFTTWEPKTRKRARSRHD
jgi:hypothetical protein